MRVHRAKRSVRCLLVSTILILESVFLLKKEESFDIHRLSDIVDKGQGSSKTKETKAFINKRRVLSSFSESRKVANVSCHLLIKGDTEEMKKSEKLTATHPKHPISPEFYVKMTRNCSEFVKEREYITDSLTKIEEDFPISYSILMYRHVEQSERLLRAIYRPQNLYCIHVDSSSSKAIHKAMSGIANCFDNVFIPRKNYKVRWGTISVLMPELSCMEELRNKSKSWKYFINLTGQEFPLKTNYELVQILKAFNGANDIEGSISRTVKNRWKHAGKPPHGIVPLQGSVHIVASRGFVDFILDDQRARDFLKWSNLTKIPDETFFATLNHNPKLGVPGSYKGYPETGLDDNVKPYVARFKNWGKGPYNWTCKGKRVRQICIFGVGDLPMVASRREMFANKFFLGYEHFALDCLEELHFNRTRDEFVGKITFNNRFGVPWSKLLSFTSILIQMRSKIIPKEDLISIPTMEEITNIYKLADDQFLPERCYNPRAFGTQEVEQFFKNLDPSGLGTPKPDIIPDMMATAAFLDNVRMDLDREHFFDTTDRKRKKQKQKTENVSAAEQPAH